MATIRRLSDEDVRSIFESVHQSRPSPAHLHFQIVPVGPEGLRLSPPSYQFQGMNENHKLYALKNVHLFTHNIFLF
jgi:hypothetical protein